MTSQPEPAAGDHGPQVQVLADEVRSYLTLHGGALDEADEQGLERFTEVFLLPAFAAVWEQGHRTYAGAPTVRTGSPAHGAQGRASNPYSAPRLRRRTLWWHRLLRGSAEETPPARNKR
jgi:hypothetical protein